MGPGRDIGNHRNSGLGEMDLLGELAEGIAGVGHEGGMEGPADLEHFEIARPGCHEQRLRPGYRFPAPGQHDLQGRIEIGGIDVRHPVLGQHRQDLGFVQPKHRCHAAPLGQPHQLAALVHEAQARGEIHHASGKKGHVLGDAVAEQVIRRRALGAPLQIGQAIDHVERGLGVLGQGQSLQGPGLTKLGHRIAEDGVGFAQLIREVGEEVAAHADALGSLPRKHEGFHDFASRSLPIFSHSTAPRSSLITRSATCQNRSSWVTAITVFPFAFRSGRIRV